MPNILDTKSSDPLGQVIQEFSRLGVTKRDLINWRIATKHNILQPTGAINGLPSLRGKCLCTDGILCLVECWNGSWYIGHFDHFIVDKKERAKSEKQSIADIRRAKYQ